MNFVVAKRWFCRAGTPRSGVKSWWRFPSRFPFLSLGFRFWVLQVHRGRVVDKQDHWCIFLLRLYAHTSPLPTAQTEHLSVELIREIVSPKPKGRTSAVFRNVYPKY